MLKVFHFVNYYSNSPKSSNSLKNNHLNIILTVLKFAFNSVDMLVVGAGIFVWHQ